MKILVALSRFPYPLEKGDKLRAFHQIRFMSQKHEVYLVALHDKAVPDADLQQLTPYCKEIFLLQQNAVRRYLNIALAFFNGLPIQCGYFFSQNNKKEFDKIIEKVRPDHIYCQLIRMAEYVKNQPLKKTLDYQDVFSKGLLRRYEKASILKKPFFKMEYHRVTKYEAEIFNYFDNKTIITAVDRDLIPHECNQTIDVVPNGVEFDKFKFNGEQKCYDLIFSGNMSYGPNVDAAEYLAKEIIPEVKKNFPGIRLVLSGASPAPAVKALQNENIIVTGWVDSMVEWYAKSRIFIAPMRMGTGLQNKLLEAMSMLLPCITSPLAAKPLDEAENCGAIIACSTTSGYVEAICRLLRDQQYCQQLSDAGHQYVRRHYDWFSAAEKLDQILSR